MTTYKEIKPADQVSGQFTVDQVRVGDTVEYVTSGNSFRTVEVLSVDEPDALTKFPTFTGYELVEVGGSKLLSYIEDSDYSKVWGYFDQIIAVYAPQQESEE